MIRADEPAARPGGTRFTEASSRPDADRSAEERRPAADWRVSRNASLEGNGGSGRKGLKVAALLLVLAALGAWNVHALRVTPEPASPESQRRLAHVKLYHAAEAIESFRRENGRLPSSLARLNIPPGDFEYVRADTGYALVLTTTDTESRYRSGTPMQELLVQAGVTNQ